MSRSHAHLLEDMETTIVEILRATEGKALDVFQRDWLLRSAVERGIEVISEASKGVPQDLKDSRPDIPWRSIHAIGNVLRHEYHRIVMPSFGAL